MFRLLRLEDRIVLDGAAMYDMLDEMADHDAHDHQMEAAAEAHENDDGGFGIHEPLGGDALNPDVLDDGGLHVLLVSSDVKGADDLADAAKGDVVVLKYDAADTNLDDLSGMINEALDGQKADSIAIAAHNVNGAQVQLTRGDTASLDSLDTGPQMDFWKGIGGYLAEDGRIDLLSCDVAGAENGDAFLAKLEVVAGAKVAASTDVTGNDWFGGDWVLETQTPQTHGPREIDIQAIYFDADLLKDFDGTLYAGQDPDPGYNDIYDRTVPSGKYTFIPVPTDTWQDPQGTASVSLSFSTGPTWLRYSASSEGFWALKPAAGDSATITIIATDGVNSVQDPFTVSAYNNALAAPAYADITTPFSVSEDAVSGTVVPAASYQTATDKLFAIDTTNTGTIVDYEIVSGNPTNGTTFGFAIDGAGDIVVSDGSLINYDDPYVVNNTHQLVVRAEDNDGIYAFSTVEIEMIQGAVDFVVDLNVSPTFLQEDPAGSNTAQITVSISPTPTSAVSIDLEFQGTGADPAAGPGAAVGDDYDVDATTLNFTAGESSKVITLTVVDDGVNEPNETFTVDVVDPGLPNYSVAAGTLTTLTITDDAKPTVGLNLDPVSFGEDSTATLTASLAGGVTVSTETAVTLTFGGTAVHGTAAAPDVNDYTSQEVITIAAGATSASITLTGVVDNTDEGGSEAFNVSVADLPANTFDIDPVAGTVNGSVNDVFVEPPVLPVVNLTTNRVSFNEGETFQITANLVGETGPFEAPAGGINVILDTTGGTAINPDDFVVPSVISIPEGFTSNSVTVFGVADGVPEPNETVGVAVGANPTAYNLIGSSTPFTVILKDVVTPVVTLEGGGTITEDPVGTTVVRAVQNTQTLTSTTVTIGIAGDPAADQSADYTAVYTSDNSPVATNAGGDWTVVIPAGDTDAGIKFTAIKDNVFDGDVNEQIVLTAKSAGTSLVGAIDTATVEIVDADAGDIPVVSLFVNNGGVLSGNGTFDEVAGPGILNGQIKLPTGEVPPVAVTVYLQPSDLIGGAVAGEDYALFSDPAASATIPMTTIPGTTEMGWAISITDGFNKANFYVDGLGDDDVFEGTESFELTIADVVNGTVGAADTIGASVLDSTTPPVITLGLAPSGVHELASEGVNTATLTIDLAAAGGTTFGTGEVTVALDQTNTVVGGFALATEGDDYTLFEADSSTPVAYDTVSGEWTVTIDLTGGATASGEFVLAGVADESAEGTEGFELKASISSTTGPSTELVTGIVIDDAQANPVIVTLDAITTASVTEGVGSAQVDFTLSREYNADLTVSLEFAGDADENDFYLVFDDGTTAPVVTTGGVLTYDFVIPNGSGLQAGFAIKAVDDSVFEPNEDLSVHITGISAAGANDDYTTNVETVTIVDGLPEPELSLFWKDTGGTSINTASFSEGDNRYLYVALDNPVSENVIVNLDFTAPTLGGADFGINADYTGTATVTILANQTEAKTLINIKDDPLYEPTQEIFNVSIADFSGPVQDSVTDQVTGIITPSDIDGEVQVTLEWLNSGTFNEAVTAGGEDSVIVQLDRNTHTTPVVVTLDFTAAPTAAVGEAEFGNDYDVETGTTIDGAGQLQVTIAVGETQAAVPLAALQDEKFEGNEAFTVSIGNVTGGLVAGNIAQEFGTQELTGNIVDDEDAPSVSIELIQNTSVIEDGGVNAAAEIRAFIDNGVLATQDITVTLDVTDGTGVDDATLNSDFTIAPPGLVLTIPAGQESSGVVDGPGVFRVVPKADTVFENDETLQVGITAAAFESGITVGFDSGPLEVTIVNDDAAPTVSVTPATAEIVEDAGTPITVQLVLSGDALDTVSVDLRFGGSASLGDDDYTMTVDGTAVTLGDLTNGIYTAEFSGGSAGTIDIVFTAVTDTDIESDESIFVIIDSVTNAVAASAPANESEVTILDDDLDVFVDLNLKNTPPENLASPNTNITENSSVFAGSVEKGLLDVNLVDGGGASTSLPAGLDTTITFQLGGTATPDDYEIALDNLFNNTVDISTLGTFDVTVDAGLTTTRLYIQAKDDDIYELDELFSIKAISSTIADISDGVGDVAVTGFIVDNNDAPTVSITSVTTDPVTEGEVTEFVVSFSGRSDVDTLVTLDVGRTGPGEASIPGDFTLGADVSFAGGAGTTFEFTAPGSDLLSGSATFRVSAYTFDDSVYDPDETITLTVATGGADYSVGTTASQAATIEDNDPAPFVELGTPTAGTMTPENGGNSQISVQLVDSAGNSGVTSGIDTLVTVDFGGTATPAQTTPVAGDDYDVLVDGGAVTFLDDNTLIVKIPAGSTNATLTLTGLADTLYEPDETIGVQIVSSDDAQVSSGVGSLLQTVVIEDDDPAPAVTLAWAAGAIDEEGGSDVLTATLGASVGVDTVVSLTFGGDADYTPGTPFAAGDDVTDLSSNAETITILAGDIQGSITFYGLSDDIYEADASTAPPIVGESFSADISQVEFVGISTVTPVFNPVTAIVVDDAADLPVVTLDFDLTSVTEGGDSAVVTVTRDQTVGVDTVVDITFTAATVGAGVTNGDFTFDGSAFTQPATTYQVTIPANQRSVTASFAATSDGAFEPSEVVFAELTGVVNGTLGDTISETVTILDNGVGKSVVSLENQATGLSAGGTDFAEVAFDPGTGTIPNTATFTVQLDTASFDARVITLQLDGDADPVLGPDFSVEVDADGTTATSETFVPVPVASDGTFQFTLPAGATQAEVRFTGEEDAFYESPESLTVSISDAGGLQVSTGADTLTYTLFDDDPAPVVELSMTNSELSENGGATGLIVSLKDPTTGADFNAQTDVVVTLDFGGTATLTLPTAGADDDYTTSQVVVTIAEGTNRSTTVFLDALNDEEYEGNETITVSALTANITNALPATAANADYIGTGPDLNVAEATIVEDDQGPTVSLTVDKTSIAEANGEAVLTLSLSFTSPVDEVVWVKFSTTDDDSVGDSAGDVWGTDAQYDYDEQYWPQDYLATDSSGVSEPMMGVEFPNGVALTITSVPVTGEDAFEVTIGKGDFSKTVFLHALNDNATIDGDKFLYEKDETFTVSIDDDSFANNLKADTANDSATVTIVDDDEAAAPNVNLAWNVGGGTYAEDPGTPNSGSFNVTLDGPTNQLVQVTLDMTGQPDDYTVDFGGVFGADATDNGDGTITLTFASDAAAQTATVGFSIADDGTYEMEETFTIAIEDVMFAKIGNDDVLTGTITDEDDLPQITVTIDTDEIPDSTIPTAELSEGDATPGPDATFIIHKGGVTTPQPILVNYVISSGTAAGEAEAGSDFSAITSGTVTLARDFDAIATVDLNVIGDDLDELNENVIITISYARYSDGTPLDGAITDPGDTATLTILDDDASPTVAVNDGAVVSEGDFGVITDADLFYTDADSSEGVITGVTNGDLILNLVTAPVNGTLYQGTPGEDFSSAVLNPGDTFFQSELISGNIWYQHDDSETTSDEFSYIVSDKPLTDSDVNTTDGIFTITVDPVNDAPSVESIVFWIQEKTTGEVSSLIDLTGDGLIVSDQDSQTTLTATITVGDPAFSLDITAGEVRLSVDTALDYEFQSSHALLVNVDDGTAPAKDVLVIVNVKDDVSEPDPFAAGTIPPPDDVLMSDTQWTFQIPDTVFPDGTRVTYISHETDGLITSPWLHFESESLTFWYDPAVNPGPSVDAANQPYDPTFGNGIADQTYNIEITATYWHQNNVIKGVSQQSFELKYDYINDPIAGLQRSREVFEALDFLDSEDGEGFLPGDGDAIEIQEMMVAGATPAEMPEAMEVPVDYELSEVLALLEGDPLIIDLETEIQEQMA